MTKKSFIGLIVLIIVVMIGAWFVVHRSPTATVVLSTAVNFTCDAGKSISATFNLPADSQVSLVLKDPTAPAASQTRSVTVPHVISADGARYANADESFVFWNVGQTAFITEGVGQNSATTFANCVEQNAGNSGGTGVNTTTGMTTYKNDQYGFQIEYPSNLTPSTTFKQYYALSNTWRSGLSDPSTTKGVAAVSIPVLQIDNNTGAATGKPYPLYFDTEVRVGVSSAPADVASCLKPDPNYTNQPVTDVMIGGVPFKKFSFQDAAMMQYVQGESYRAVHNGMCFAVEQVETGSHYSDPTMTAGTSDAQLKTYYDQAGTILQSFQFTR